MDNKLTWLHLSDLHLTCRKNKDNDWTVKSINQDIVIRSLLEAIDKLLIQKEQKLDLIFITGDLVHGGKAEEYEVAKEFCQQLLKITGLSKQQLFIVAGNHDVNRGEIKPIHSKSFYQFNNQDDISEILSDSDIYPVLMRKLDGFYKFSNDFLELDCKPEQHYIIAKPIEIVEKQLKINLLGLNSSLFAGYDGDDKKKLAFGLYQSEQALLNLDNNAHLSIAFFHHPFSCFHDCEKTIQNQLKEKVDLILTGHLHDPSNMSQHDAAGKAVIIGAGASYEKRESENSFNVGVLDLETGQGKVQFYKYLEKFNRWTKNTDINLDEDDDGRFSFVIPSLQKNPLIAEKKTPESDKTPLITVSTVVYIPIETEITAEQAAISNKEVDKPIKTSTKIAVLIANPINRNYEYDELLKGFKKLKCEVNYFYLSCDALNNLEDYDYIFIASKWIKDKIVIENPDLSSRTVSLKELEENIGNHPKGVFIFLDQAIDATQIIELPLPTVILPTLSKEQIQSFLFFVFKKCKTNDDWFIFNKSALVLTELQAHSKECHRHFKTPLPDAIDPKTTQNYVGRVSDLEVICKKIIDLKDEKNGFLTIKGSGGIGKTHIVRKIAVELAARSFFPDGIDFVDCEFISDYKLFEFNLAQTFNLEQSINAKEYIRKHEVIKDSLLILDNFETLLHLSDANDIKDFLNFICDYVTVVVTSREWLELDCEQEHILRHFTTDEALELFEQELRTKLDKDDKNFLRNEIIETLLGNNPLAIKLITKNLPIGKDFRALKAELEEDIFQKLTDIELEAFDSYSDTNIERKKSLYASISFSYNYLCDSEKMVFELLSLFPDGINIENLRRITDKNRENMRSNSKEKSYNLCITDVIINSLDKKSMIENNSGTIKLQSIIGRFAEQKLGRRENMQNYYNNAFDYNQFLIFFLSELKDSDECLALKIFNAHKNNFLKSISYIDLLDYKKNELLNYLEAVSINFITICTNKNFIAELGKKRNYFLDDEKEKLYFDLLILNSRYFDGDFEEAFKELTKKVPKNRIEYLDGDSELERAVIGISSNIYGMEGYAYFDTKISEKFKFTGGGDLFYIGEYNSILNSYEDREFFYFETNFNCNTIDINELDNYLKSVYKKDHIEIMSCHYLKAKIGLIDKAIINKLVIVNPYTQGLQQLIYAFCETDTDNAISLYEEALENLKHIKYYYVEALYFYAKFLKEQGLQQQYDDCYQQGNELARKHYFRFLIYKFEDLVEPKTIPYDPKNYPLPNNDNFDDYINFLIKNLKHQK